MFLLLSHLLLPATAMSAQNPDAKGCIADLQRFVGGHWEGKQGNEAVSIRFESSDEGQSIRGVGKVIIDGKTTLTIDTRYGWDENAHLTYYLGARGHDIVYYGHVIGARGVLKTHFTNLCNPLQTFDLTEKFVNDDTVESKLANQKDKLVLTRIKD